MLPLLALSFTILMLASTNAAPAKRQTKPHGVTIGSAGVDGQTFDYIIVGGGLAGLTVASRLSENSSVSVLVIEAGADDRKNPWVYDLSQYYAFSGTSLDWNWQVEGGKSIKGGKTLGGSSSINGAHYTRGDSVQYDAWAKLLPGSSWGWDKMFAYMKKSEGFNTPTQAQVDAGASYEADFHGTDGPLQVSFPGGMYNGPGQSDFNRTISSSAFGVPFSKDANGGDAAAVAFTLSMLNPSSNYDRSSSATAYFSPVEESRTNWLILAQYQVTKLIWSSEDSKDGKRATGVNFKSDYTGTENTVYANKEVIIACGSIQSPALLQLSGVGPTAVLSSAGVDTVIDLPGVGKNLNEQTSNVIGYTPNSGIEFGGTGPSDTIAFPSFNQLFGTASEATASQLASDLPAYAKAAAAAGGVVSETAATTLFELQRGLIVDNQVGLAELFFDSGYPNGGFGFDIWNLLPFSRGTVEITSKDPFVAPKIDPKYFAFDFDLDVQAAAMQMGRRAFQTAPLSTVVSGENSPGSGTVADDGKGGTLDNWKTYVKSSYGSVSHPISTCAMMSQDLGGVVGEDLKVYGTANVRVVDASVLPMQVSAHLSASIYGVAEYGADLIKAEASTTPSTSTISSSVSSSLASSVGLNSSSTIASTVAAASSVTSSSPTSSSVPSVLPSSSSSNAGGSVSGGSVSGSRSLASRSASSIAATASAGSSNAGATSSATPLISLERSGLMGTFAFLLFFVAF